MVIKPAIIDTLARVRLGELNKSQLFTARAYNDITLLSTSSQSLDEDLPQH